MRLSTPTFMTVLVSLVLLVVAILAKFGTQFGGIAGHSFAIEFIAYLVLLAGVLVRGL